MRHNGKPKSTHKLDICHVLEVPYVSDVLPILQSLNP